jgi:hypothetical protein
MAPHITLPHPLYTWRRIQVLPPKHGDTFCLSCGQRPKCQSCLLQSTIVHLQHCLFSLSVSSILLAQPRRWMSHMTFTHLPAACAVIWLHRVYSTFPSQVLQTDCRRSWFACCYGVTAERVLLVCRCGGAKTNRVRRRGGGVTAVRGQIQSY